MQSVRVCASREDFRSPPIHIPVVTGTTRAGPTNSTDAERRGRSGEPRFPLLVLVSASGSQSASRPRTCSSSHSRLRGPARPGRCRPLKAAGRPTTLSGVIRAIRSISAIRVSGVHDPPGSSDSRVGYRTSLKTCDADCPDRADEAHADTARRAGKRSTAIQVGETRPLKALVAAEGRSK